MESIADHSAEHKETSTDDCSNQRPRESNYVTLKRGLLLFPPRLEHQHYTSEPKDYSDHISCSNCLAQGVIRDKWREEGFHFVDAECLGVGCISKGQVQSHIGKEAASTSSDEGPEHVPGYIQKVSFFWRRSLDADVAYEHEWGHKLIAELKCCKVKLFQHNLNDESLDTE